MALIGLTLGIMLVLTLFAILLGSGYVETDVFESVDTTLTQNGTAPTTLQYAGDFDFAITELQGAIAIILLIVTITAIFGINILGSGLSDESVRFITLAFLYSGLWGVLSVVSISLITAIELFGPLIYISLTIVYVIGVIKKITIGG